MPRLARHIEPELYYHVISRSINEMWIFKDDSDFSHFCQLEGEAKKKFPLRLFHYALMNTHFHFVLQAPSKEGLSKHLSHIKWHYTLWVRRKYGWKGSLWRERYKSLPIEDESYLAACGRYVEYNPVRAGICHEPADYRYTSYRKYHLGIPDDLLDEYDEVPDYDDLRGWDFQSEFSKTVFSRSAAIGNPIFVEKYRSSRK